MQKPNDTIATYDVEMIDRAIVFFDEIAAKGVTGQRMLRMAGCSEGTGLGVWSSNVTDYADRVAQQLRILRKGL